MPKGPKGEKRPADINKLAFSIMKAATQGETLPVPYRREAGLKGSKKRHKTLSPKKRSKIASHAAKTRWKSSRKNN